MKNKFEFNSTRDFRSHNFKERPKDVVIDNKSIFEREKTPAQQEVVKTAFHLLNEHIKELGIEIKKPFDQKRVIFGYGRRIEEGMYHEGDFVFMNPDSEGNLETMIHEFTHAYSSEWRNYDEAELENYLNQQQKRRNKVKSGFHIVYSRSEKTDMFKMENEELPQINFWSLNEGITEKIAREIISKNTKELDRLKPLFEGVLERKLQEKEREFNKIELPEVEAEIEEKRKQYDDELKQLELKKEAFKKDFNEKIANESDTEKKEELEFSKRTEEILVNMDIKFKKDNIQELPQKIEQAKRLYSYEVTDLKRNYSFSSLEQGAYDFEVLIVDKIIKGLGKTYLKQNQSSNISVEESRAWHDLQKAYFAGKTVFLRKIEEAFGVGFLRKVEKVSPLMTNEEKEKLLTDIQKLTDKIYE